MPAVAPSRLVLLGHPVAQSLSPLFQNAALRAAGIDARYEALEVEAVDLPWTLTHLREARVAGNVTAPHKAAIARACDRRSPLAERTGSVNTFWFDGSDMIGDNTDVGGFEAAVTELLGARPRGMTFGILGAGGAAAAALAAIERFPECRAAVWNRTTTRAQELVARFGAVARVGDVADVLAVADCVVNATRVGLTTDDHPVAIDALSPSQAVVDLVYRVGETPWVRAARGRGLRAMDGLHMLVEQGALAFQRWFGIEPDRRAMWAAIRTVDPSR